MKVVCELVAKCQVKEMEEEEKGEEEKESCSHLLLSGSPPPPTREQLSPLDQRRQTAAQTGFT